MANKTGHKAPLTYANIVRIVPHQAAQPPQRKQSVSRSRPEQTQEVTRSDGVLSHSANEGRSEEGLDAKGNKRRQLKQDHKKEKDMIYEDARAQGVIVIPGAKPENLNNDHLPESELAHPDNCICQFCKCKFTASPSERELCTERAHCIRCQSIRSMLEDQMTETREAHKLYISQLLQAMSELDKGLLNERRTELEKQRKRREQQELNQKLTAQLAELKEQCAQAEKRQVDLRNELARVEDIRKEQKKIDIQKRKDEGNYWLPVE